VYHSVKMEHSLLLSHNLKVIYKYLIRMMGVIKQLGHTLAIINQLPQTVNPLLFQVEQLLLLI
jgi:hypothetical protein